MKTYKLRTYDLTIVRILIIHPHLGFFGGSERLTRILIYELERADQEVIVVTESRNEVWFPETRLVKFERIKCIFEYEKPSALIPLHLEKIMDLMYSFNEVIFKYEPDVVLSMIQEPIYAVLVKIVKPELKSAIYIHYPIEEELTSENFYFFVSSYRFPSLYEQFYKTPDLHMTNSNYTAHALYSMFGIESNVVYPAVEWDFFETSEEASEEERKGNILCIGRFVPQKRQDVLIDWFRRIIKPKFPQSRLILIGIPDKRHIKYYERLKMLAEETKDVEFIDRVLTNEEIIKYYREANVYIHLRIGEHFGLVPVEAASQGAIPIVPEKSGIAELVSHGRDGFIASNDEEFIRYLLKLLAASKEELQRMRRFARRKAWYFNPDRFAKEVLASLRIITKVEALKTIKIFKLS